MSDDRPTSRSTRSAGSAATRGRSIPPRTDAKLFWLATLVVFGLMAAADVPNEIVRWRHAAAIVRREGGDQAGAYEQLTMAYQGRTKEPGFVRELIRWHEEDEQYAEALKLRNNLMEGGRPDWNALRKRSELLMKLGRFQEAVDDCLEIDRLSRSSGEPTRAQALNQLAYCRAVGGIDLQAAEIEVEQSVTSSRAELETRERAVQRMSSWNWWNANERLGRFVLAQGSLAGCLDTRGFIRFKLGKLEEAKRDLNEAITLEARFNSAAMPSNAKRERRYREYELQKASVERNTAVLLYHRGLIYQKLGDVSSAARDFTEVHKLLGRDADETLF